MKEYQSTTGGRYIFNEDMQNLQELALSMTKLFESGNMNFVISGCDITVTEENDECTISISNGFAYINDKIVEVEAYSNTVSSIRKIWIKLNTKNGPDIMYADGSQHHQYVEYYGKITVNFTPPSLPPASFWDNILSAIQDNDGNWAFPNVTTGFFKAHGLLNSDVIIDILQNNTIDLSTPKQFVIGGIPAQIRSSSNLNQYINDRLTDGEIENGAVAILYNNELEDFLSGKFSLENVYLHSNCTFQWAMAMPNETKGSNVSDVFTVRTSDLEDGETASFVLDSDIVDNIRAAMGNGEIGLYLWILSGSIDIASVCKSYPETLYFGKCKNDRPERVYRYCKDLTQENNIYVFLNSAQWNSLSSEEKALWKPTIDNGEINSSKLANGAVTNNKLANGAVTAEKLAADALICNISSYMNVGVSILPMGKIYMYGVYPLEARACRVEADQLPALVLAWYRGEEDDPTSSYPNPYMLFVYTMADDSNDFVYEGSYTWNNAPAKYKSIYTIGIQDGSITLAKLADTTKEAFWKRPLIYDQDNVRLSNVRLNLERLRGPLSIESVAGEEDVYVLRITAPTLLQFNNLVDRVTALENANNS
jgi:hypothetical protein